MYGVCDKHGNVLVFEEPNERLARQLAQRAADECGESVWLNTYAIAGHPASYGEGEEVHPAI
jgi:hypothetical protein